MTVPVAWTPVVVYDDIRYEHSGTGIAKVTIARPDVRNAFRPQTVRELIDAFARIRDDATIGCVLLTGEGDMAFCSGGDQTYKSHEGGYLDSDGLARLNVLDLQRQIWFLCRQYSAQEALDMHLVNTVVPLADLEAEGVQWADEILQMSPTAIRFLKSAFLVATDGLAGMQEFAGNATGLYYTTDEAHEGSTAFLEKRPAEYTKYPRRP